MPDDDNTKAIVAAVESAFKRYADERANRDAIYDPEVRFREIIKHELKSFEDRVKSIVHEDTEDTFRRIGLRIDDENIDETREKLGAIMRQSKAINRLSMTAGTALALGIFYAILKLLGLKIAIPGVEAGELLPFLQPDFSSLLSWMVRP